MKDKEAKELHLKDANKTLKELLTSDLNETTKQSRAECLNEFITMIETGNTDHINVNEDGKRIEHFK